MEGKSMSWFMIAIRVIAELPGLITTAEKAFDGVPDSNADKKLMVTETVKTLFGILFGVTTGDQAAMWKRVEMIVSPLIDFFCRFMFKDEVK